MTKKVSHVLQAVPVKLMARFLAALPPSLASFAAGRLLRSLSPLFRRQNKIALQNLRRTFPTFSAARHHQILNRMWENLGRNAGELPHLQTLLAPQNRGIKWEIRGAQNLERARKENRPIIFFSGHLGNWEIMPGLLAASGLPFASLYRPPNNPEINRLLKNLRRKILPADIPSFPKGRHGGRSAFLYLKRGGHIGALGDQKLNDGITLKLFGHAVKGPDAPVCWALRANALIVPGHVARQRDGVLLLTVEPPFFPENLYPHLPVNARVKQITQDLYALLEKWITENPEGWLWIHRRWEKEWYQAG